MVTDAKMIFDEAVAVTTSKSSTNVVDLNNITEAAKGQPVYLNVLVDTTFTSAANGLTITLCASSGATPASGDKVLEIVPATLASVLTKGKLYRQALPEDIPYEQLNLYYLATTALAAGKITCFLSI